jgi:hypothetical protein
MQSIHGLMDLPDLNAEHSLVEDLQPDAEHSGAEGARSSRPATV